MSAWWAPLEGVPEIEGDGPSASRNVGRGTRSNSDKLLKVGSQKRLVTVIAKSETIHNTGAVNRQPLTVGWRLRVSRPLTRPLGVPSQHPRRFNTKPKNSEAAPLPKLHGGQDSPYCKQKKNQNWPCPITLLSETAPLSFSGPEGSKRKVAVQSAVSS